MDGSGEKDGRYDVGFQDGSEVPVFRSQAPPSGSSPQIPAVFKITVIHFLSAKGFIFQQTDGADISRFVRWR